MNSERLVEWQLGTWLGLSPGLCWMLFALAVTGAAALTAYFYRYTLRALSWRQRLIFTVLRSGFLLALLICLAGPARVERTYDSTRELRPLAVIVDRSASMAIPDSHGTTRLASALRVWKKVEPAALRTFPSLHYYDFSVSLEKASDLESAVTGPQRGDGTDLYDSLDQAMKDAPPGGYGGIVCLTDGLDTTDATPEACGARSLQDHCPLYFAAGEGREPPGETLLVREMDVPGQVLRKSQFTARVVVEARGTRERDVPVSLWMDHQPIAQTNLHLRAGVNLIPWTVPVNSGEPGLLRLDGQLGQGKEEESISAAIRVVAQEQVPILFYQGALDWSFRFVNAALQSDPSFVLTGLFSPELSLSREVLPSGAQGGMTQMPDAVADLQPFKVVVLSNIIANQLSAAQQTALTDYVQGGGGLLFLVSDTELAATFSGTPLESLLPVIFEAPPKNQDDDESVEEFEQKMQDASGPGLDPAAKDGSVSTNAFLEPLQKFAFPPGPGHSDMMKLFGAASGDLLQNVPQFSTYARVHGIKAGAEVLAVHPEDKTDVNTPRALLVTQRFGRGHITALLTDGLWRWKLSLPSTSQDPQIFWQQLFHILAQEESAHRGLRFSRQPFFASLGQTSPFRLDGAEGPTAPTVTANSPGEPPQALPVQFDPVSDSWSFQFIPNEPGKWRIHAEDGREAQMETWLRVSGSSHASELSGLPADTEGLRKLAESTGGSLLNDGTPAKWSASNAPTVTTLVSKRSEPLWDTWLVLSICLGLYVTELLWRRHAKLL